MHTTAFPALHTLRPLAALALVAALGATACTSEIIGGGTGGGDGGAGGEAGTGNTGTGTGNAGTGTGNTGTGTGNTGTGGSVAGPVESVAEWAGMMNEIPPGGAPPSDPNTLFVKIGNYGPVCGGMFDFGCGPGVTWQLAVGLPPGMQGPGVYSLANPAVIASSAESGGGPGNPGECWGGVGGSLQGTIEVVSNDGSTIVVRLQGTSGSTEFDADGEYAVPICQWGLD